VTALDTGICAAESRETLLLQQKQLMAGRRAVQMFPTGTDELPLPEGCARVESCRGMFHYRPEVIAPERICNLSTLGRENEFLMLGPFSKYDVAVRAKGGGEPVICITEYIGDTELRSACGVPTTIATQWRYFDKTREPDGRIVIGEPPPRVAMNWKGS
jgi:hypothetical protein